MGVISMICRSDSAFLPCVVISGFKVRLALLRMMSRIGLPIGLCRGYLPLLSFSTLSRLRLDLAPAYGSPDSLSLAFTFCVTLLP
jgi:hypothetical protein